MREPRRGPVTALPRFVFVLLRRVQYFCETRALQRVRPVREITFAEDRRRQMHVRRPQATVVKRRRRGVLAISARVLGRCIMPLSLNEITRLAQTTRRSPACDSERLT